MTIRTHYANLQVAENASPEVIRGAYRYLSQKWHPDKNPDSKAKAERITQIINDAYAVLSDPQRKREYDQWIAAERDRSTQSASLGTGNSAPAAHGPEIISKTENRDREWENPESTLRRKTSKFGWIVGFASWPVAVAVMALGGTSLDVAAFMSAFAAVAIGLIAWAFAAIFGRIFARL